MPNELILQVAESLALPDLNSLLQTNHFFAVLLTPVILDLAATSFLPRSDHRYVIHWAASHNRGTLMRSLLARGAWACINIGGPAGMTPLHSAVVLGYEEPVKILLENGADTEILNRAGWTALMAAVITGNHSLSMLLLENGANIDSKGWNVGDIDALHYAAGLGHINIVNLLVEKGCNTRSLNMYQVNAVQTASVCGEKEMVEHLLRLGGFGSNDKVSPRVHDLSQNSIVRSKPSLEHILYHEVDYCITRHPRFKR